MALMITGCRFHEDRFVDFSDLTAAKDLRFQVLGQRETDLSEGLPYDCFLPDGCRVSEWTEEMENAEVSELNKVKATSSVTGAAILQELLKYGNQNKVIEIVGTYPSTDGEWNGVTLSGKVILPKGRSPNGSFWSATIP